MDCEEDLNDLIITMARFHNMTLDDYCDKYYNVPRAYVISDISLNNHIYNIIINDARFEKESRNLIKINKVIKKIFNESDVIIKLINEVITNFYNSPQWTTYDDIDDLLDMCSEHYLDFITKIIFKNMCNKRRVQ